MRSELVDDELREDDCADACPGLRSLHLVLAVERVDGSLDPDLQTVEVDVLTSQLRRLAEADGAPGEEYTVDR